jgi:hypothetical protein
MTCDDHLYSQKKQYIFSSANTSSLSYIAFQQVSPTQRVTYLAEDGVVVYDLWLLVRYQEVWFLPPIRCLCEQDVRQRRIDKNMHANHSIACLCNQILHRSLHWTTTQIQDTRVTTIISKMSAITTSSQHVFNFVLGLYCPRLVFHPSMLRVFLSFIFCKRLQM